MTLAAVEPPNTDTVLSNDIGLTLPTTWLFTLSVLAIIIMIIGGAAGFRRHSATGHRECRTEVDRRSQQQSNTAKDRFAPGRCRNHGNNPAYCKDRTGGNEPIRLQKVPTCVDGIVSPDDEVAAGTDFAFYTFLATVFFGTIAVFGILLTYSQARDVALLDA